VNYRFEFDEWTKDLARGVSRREALRRLGGGLAGAILAWLGVGRAWAAPNPCSAFCNSLRHPAQRKNCNNACKQCGDNVQNVCPSLDSDKVTCCSQGTGCCSGTCSSLGTNQNCAACGNACTGGQSCVNGTCQCPSGQAICPGGTTCCPTTQACCNGVCCNAGEGCNGGACVAARVCRGDYCTGTVNQCPSQCDCFATTEGGSLCLDDTSVGVVCGTNACMSSDECPAGTFCAAVACCEAKGGPVGQGVCLPAGPCLT
jgi:hypothetical protein